MFFRSRTRSASVEKSGSRSSMRSIRPWHTPKEGNAEVCSAMNKPLSLRHFQTTDGPPAGISRTLTQRLWPVKEEIREERQTINVSVEAMKKRPSRVGRGRFCHVLHRKLTTRRPVRTVFASYHFSDSGRLHIYNRDQFKRLSVALPGFPFRQGVLL